MLYNKGLRCVHTEITVVTCCYLQQAEFTPLVVSVTNDTLINEVGCRSYCESKY